MASRTTSSTQEKQTQAPTVPLNGDLGSELDAVKHDLANLRSHLGSLVNTATGAGLSKADDTRGKIESELERTTEQLKQRSSQALKAVERDVGSKPLTALAAAFGVGFLAAKLFGRGR